MWNVNDVATSRCLHRQVKAESEEKQNQSKARTNKIHKVREERKRAVVFGVSVCSAFACALVCVRVTLLTTNYRLICFDFATTTSSAKGDVLSTTTTITTPCSLRSYVTSREVSKSSCLNFVTQNSFAPNDNKLVSWPRWKPRRKRMPNLTKIIKHVCQRQQRRQQQQQPMSN